MISGSDEDQNKKGSKKEFTLLPFCVNMIKQTRQEAVEMDLMVGSNDVVRLRRDLLRQLRSMPNQKSPVIKNKIYTAQLADEQTLIAMAKKESMDIRRYIR